MWKQITTIAFGILSVIIYYLFVSGESYISIRRTFKDLRSSYDFIIIGGGTSGSVLASRLSENAQINVLLIERGQEASRASYVPLLAPLQGFFDPTWGYESEPQRYSHFGFINKISRVTRGQSLGGSGHYNYHIISNETFKLCPLERRRKIQAKGSPYDILAGNSKITDDILGNAFLSEKIRYPGWKFETIIQGLNEGKRFSNLDAYLKPAMNRKNLHVLIHSEVTKIDFKEKNPHSIHIFNHKDKRSYTMKGVKKLILAAGAINTPKLLFESGIGPKKTVESLNLSLVQDLPIGEELQDHLTCPLYFHLQNDTEGVNLANLISPRQIWQYLYHGKGIYSKSALSVQAIDPEEDAVILIYNVGAPHKDIYTKLSGMKPDTFEETFPSNKDPWKRGFIFLAGCTKPRSIGQLHLHPNKSLSINPNYLNDNFDIQCATRAIRSAVDIGSGENFKKLGAKLHLPKYAECSNHDPSFTNDDYVACIARTSCMTKFHPTSTTPMDAVVERNFKVKNMENIFIVDGGVLQRGSFMYPNSVITDMAECASESLLENT